MDRFVERTPEFDGGQPTPDEGVDRHRPGEAGQADGADLGAQGRAWGLRLAVARESLWLSLLPLEGPAGLLPGCPL